MKKLLIILTAVLISLPLIGKPHKPHKIVYDGVAIVSDIENVNFNEMTDRELFNFMFDNSQMIRSIEVTPENPQEPWEVPTEYKTMKNPVTVGDDGLKNGEMYYKKYCASCHGKTGLGDSPRSRMLKTFPGDFSGDVYQNQTDGEHFYKTKFGRGEMPKYDKKIPDENIWDMVNYMRTFKK